MSRERPILMSAPMVRALLSGAKTQTRRVVKPQPWASCCIEEGMEGEPPFVYSALYGDGPGHDVHETRTPCRCPYGEPGDRLWVRESFSGARAYETRGYPLREWGNKIFYWADGQPRSGDWTRPRPSIHMPRSLSRITLEITGVRVEKLQAISEADAMDEGCRPALMSMTGVYCGADVMAASAREYRDAYRLLWEQINGPGSWDANPWVWVLEFRTLERQ